MFSRGAIPGKVKTWSYAPEDEDFTKGRMVRVIISMAIDSRPLVDATALDVWVLDQLKTLLRNATVDATLDSQLRSEKVVFFLHLLGLDTTGHSYRPHSKVRPSFDFMIYVVPT
jgi:phosphatidylinositol glycan class N